MQDLSNIRKYKKGDALKGFSGLRGADIDQVKDLGVFGEVAKAIENEIDLLKKSLKAKKHDSDKSSLTLGQSIFSDLEFKQSGSVVEADFNLSSEVGYYLNYGTKPSQKNPPNSMLDSLYTWGNSRGIFQTAQTQKKQRSLAYGMAKSILAKGIIKRYGYSGSSWATDVVGPNLEKMQLRITDKISAALGKSVEVKITNDMKNMFKNGNNNNGKS